MSIDHEVYRKAKEKEEQGRPLTAEEITAIYIHEQEVLCDLCHKVADLAQPAVQEDA